MSESLLCHAGLMEAITIGQNECFEAALTFAKQVRVLLMSGLTCCAELSICHHWRM